MSTAMLHPVPGERHPSRHCGGTTTSDAEVAKSVAASFKAFDSGDKGWLNKHDLKCAFISLVGRKPDAREVSTMRDACPRGEVDLRHFRMFMEPGLVAAAKDTSQRAVHERTIATFGDGCSHDGTDLCDADIGGPPRRLRFVQIRTCA